MAEKKHLLNSKQMAQFVVDGFLQFDELVPTKLNNEVLEEMATRSIPQAKPGSFLSEIWQEAAIGEVFRLPKVEGIMHSLIGPNSIYDHHAVHTVPAGHELAQHWHADAIIDTRMHFDIQFMYFAHDTPREMGGTMILPGSHYRRISESDIARYQNFIGQLPVVCKAGTLLVLHHGMWHCAQPNRTDQIRYMFKLRLYPTVRQLRLWNTDDIDEHETTKILGNSQKWHGNEQRLEHVNRIKFWRFLTGDNDFDSHYWLSRLENEPELV